MLTIAKFSLAAWATENANIKIYIANHCNDSRNYRKLLYSLKDRVNVRRARLGVEMKIAQNSLSLKKEQGCWKTINAERFMPPRFQVIIVGFAAKYCV